ncbi:DUF4259 domain-containing protein [Luteimonas sp. MC1572]|uniref:DUF4259 domain-containing protein n=1 Tax=Luteimonas sp. MC1572 TaxID=2799325 RepID=UPI0018F07151|nr:DUF4259 domain-containing protein [Luteimonas sp. MC1572]MBJ6981962.1 DUF4259 domain-containing protein [Luteimonas sp. MC1572]QQO03263.1 DUF4259 domain-containing protein [Luteimonas sp. MC1572]
MRYIALFVALLLSLTTAYPVAAGTWGYGQFDSDHALDFAADWAEAGTVESIREALTFAAGQAYLGAPDAEKALVAAEVVAASLGKPNDKLPAELATWISRQPPQELRSLVPLALSAIDRVRNPSGSELYELWDDQGAEQWLTHVNELVIRLKS